MTDLSLWCTLSVILAAGILIILERRFPYHAGQALFRRGFWMDLVLYSLAQSYGLGIIIAWIVRGLDVLLHQPRCALVAELPWLAQLGIFFVLHDFYIYWFHRWQHHNKYLWRLHEAHHSTHDVDWLSGSRSHPLEILINQSVEFAPMILLGAAPEVVVLKTALDAVWGMYIHSNIDVHSAWLQRVLNGPEMHRWHHTASKEAHHYNFGTKLALWDWLFGTAWWNPPHKPSAYGLRSKHYPTDYIGQTLYAFRRRAGKKAQT